MTIVHRLVAADLLEVPPERTPESQRAYLRKIGAQPLEQDRWRLPADWRDRIYSDSDSQNSGK